MSHQNFTSDGSKELAAELLVESADFGELHAYVCHPSTRVMLILSVYYPISHVWFTSGLKTFLAKIAISNVSTMSSVITFDIKPFPSELHESSHLFYF